MTKTGVADVAGSARGEQSDEVLAALIRKDEGAFSELYRRYIDPIYRFMRYQAPLEEAKDLTAQVFLHAFRAADQFRGNGSSYRAWLFRIAHNTAASWRRLRHKMPVPVPDVPESIDVTDGTSAVDAADVRRALWEAVGELSPSDRELIELRYVEGMQPKEIAQVTGGSDGAVRVRMHRLLRRLRANLERRGVKA